MNASGNRSSNSDSNSNNSDSHSSACTNTHLKRQVKMVAGELENVLGELKTVVVDLRQLVTQIDEVTSKIDQEYGLDVETLDKTKRRLSTSVLETRSSRQGKYRMTASHSFDLMAEPGYQRDCVSVAEMGDLSPTDSASLRSNSTAYRRRMQRLLNPQSGNIFTEKDNWGAHIKPRTKSFSKPELISSACYECVENHFERSAEELNHSQLQRLTCIRDGSRERDSRISNSSVFRSSQRKFDHIPRAQELMAMRMTKAYQGNEKPLLPVSNGIAQVQSRNHKHHRKSPKSSTVEYSGVYEKELDSLLECDEMQQCDSFDETSYYDADDGKVCTTRDNHDTRHDVNAWTTYTMMHIGTQGYSDELLSETTETASDILNDNPNTNRLNSFGIKFTDNASAFPAS